MRLLAFTPKNIKVRRLPVYFCPSPQHNAKCSGKFIKTRVGQKECLECMRVHGTLDKHPLYKRVLRHRYYTHFGVEHIYTVHTNML